MGQNPFCQHKRGYWWCEHQESNISDGKENSASLEMNSFDGTANDSKITVTRVTIGIDHMRFMYGEKWNAWCPDKVFVFSAPNCFPLMPCRKNKQVQDYMRQKFNIFYWYLLRYFTIVSDDTMNCVPIRILNISSHNKKKNGTLISWTTTVNVKN